MLKQMMITNDVHTWSPHFQSGPRITLVPTFIIRAISGPTAGKGGGVRGFLLSSIMAAATISSSSPFSSSDGPASRKIVWKVKYIFLHWWLREQQFRNQIPNLSMLTAVCCWTNTFYLLKTACTDVQSSLQARCIRNVQPQLRKDNKKRKGHRACVSVQIRCITKSDKSEIQ